MGSYNCLDTSLTRFFLYNSVAAVIFNYYSLNLASDLCSWREKLKHVDGSQAVLNLLQGKGETENINSARE